MKKLILLIAIVPALSSAAAPGPASGDPSRDRRFEKRMRLARAVGLAEALDLDEAAALHIRDVLVRYDAQRAPLQGQVRAAVTVLRDAARDDAAAAAQVEQALQRARDGRARLQQLDSQLLDEITKGLAPEKKAKAAIFLATFRQRAQRLATMRRGGPGAHERGMPRDGRGGRRAMDEGVPPDGAATGPERHAMARSFDGAPGLESAFGAD
jgi:hypothetical protein